MPLYLQTAELAKALKTDVNSLPLSLDISWFEQKAVAVLLTLLHLGVKNIRLGPVLPVGASFPCCRCGFISWVFMQVHGWGLFHLRRHYLTLTPYMHLSHACRPS